MKKKSISTKSPTKLLEKLWETSTKAQKKSLLKERGLHQSWAETKTIREMVDRGGGMVASNLLELVKLYNKMNPQIKRVNFKN